MSTSIGEWEKVSEENGIEVYRNTVTGEIDVVDCYEAP